MKEEIVEETSLDAFEQNIIDLYADKFVALSNSFVQSRAKTSLFESKIELLAIYRMKDSMKTRIKKDARGKEYNVHYVKLYSSEINNLMGRSKRSGSIYGQIEAAAIMMKQKLFIFRDPEQNQFKMDNLYGSVEYKSGELDIEFNPELEYLFLEMNDNYTKLQLDIAFLFRTNGGFQIYKLLKSYAYTLPEIDFELPQEEQEYLIKEYTLSELRLQLGYVDLNQPDIKREGSKANPDPEKMTEMEKRPKFKRWADFNTSVIQPGCREINRISDIYIDSVSKVCGAHGKVEKVAFKFQRNKAYYEKKQKEEGMETSKVSSQKTSKEVKKLTEEELDDFIDLLGSVISYDLKIREKKAIAEAANYDIDRIKKANEVLKEYESHNNQIDNVVGFMITAIEKGFEPSTKGKQPDKTSKQQHSFTGRPYDETDYAELERQLLKR